MDGWFHDDFSSNYGQQQSSVLLVCVVDHVEIVQSGRENDLMVLNLYSAIIELMGSMELCLSYSKPSVIYACGP
jgi:hypothetical protein